MYSKSNQLSCKFQSSNTKSNDLNLVDFLHIRTYLRFRNWASTPWMLQWGRPASGDGGRTRRTSDPRQTHPPHLLLSVSKHILTPLCLWTVITEGDKALKDIFLLPCQTLCCSLGLSGSRDSCHLRSISFLLFGEGFLWIRPLCPCPDQNAFFMTLNKKCRRLQCTKPSVACMNYLSTSPNIFLAQLPPEVSSRATTMMLALSTFFEVSFHLLFRLPCSLILASSKTVPVCFFHIVADSFSCSKSSIVGRKNTCMYTWEDAILT